MREGRKEMRKKHMHRVIQSVRRWEQVRFVQVEVCMTRSPDTHSLTQSGEKRFINYRERESERQNDVSKRTVKN